MKKIRCVLFDLDGTLLPMDQDRFTEIYFSKLGAWFAPLGYDPKELLDTIWGAVVSFVKGTGECTNEEVFRKALVGQFGERIERDFSMFDRFYEEVFGELEGHCGKDPMAARTVRALKEKGYTVVLATNPIFPRVATVARLRWTGLEPEEFALCTTYENSRFCKPRAEYYLGIAETLGVSPEECLMVGNDVSDDMPAAKLGMQVFLVTPCLINRKNEDISVYPNGTFADLLTYIERQE